MNCLYFDCFCGISGDMTLAALIDLGLPRRYLLDELARLDLHGYRIKVSRSTRCGIAGRQLRVTIPRAAHHHHRTLADITGMIETSTLSARVKAGSIAVFERLARAEAAVHRKKPAEIHFHEVGAVDSIIDIVGVMIGIDYFGAGSIHASAVPLGSGLVTCAHGTLPVPVPATVRLLQGVPVYDSGIRSEIVTPTGAALITGLAAGFGPMPAMTITAVGYGAGSREHANMPNMLRIVQGELQAPVTGDSVWVLETSIDDMSPEWAGFAMEELFAAGALDVSFTPCQMKKNRPGLLLSVICRPQDRQLLTSAVLQHTTSAGLRAYPAERTVLERGTTRIKTRFGTVSAKVLHDARGSRIVPEYETCAALARKKGLPLREVYEAVIAAAQNSHTAQGVSHKGKR